MRFGIVADSCINLPEEIINNYGIEIVSLNYTLNGEIKRCYIKGQKVDQKALYEKMRKKEEITTSLASPEDFEKSFYKFAEEGKDILCVCIGSTLSGTYQSAKIAADIVKLKFPDIKICITDTLNGSFGEGLLCYYAAIKRDEGCGLDEVYEYIEKEKYNMCSWFTFDDLFYLKRGGRVSSKTAFVGTMLGIKPVMNVTKEGIIIPNAKLRGRKQAIDYLIEKFGEIFSGDKNQIVGIAHGDCEQEALLFRDSIKKRYGISNFFVEYLDPVIGLHGGPGALAIFFLGKKD